MFSSSLRDIGLEAVGATRVSPHSHQRTEVYGTVSQKHLRQISLAGQAYGATIGYETPIRRLLAKLDP